MSVIVDIIVKYVMEEDILSILDYRELQLRYDSKSRIYHNFEHACLVYAYSTHLARQHDDETVLKLFLASMYHDAVYEVTSKTNEEDSAELFRKSYAATMILGDDQEIIRAILATKDHTNPDHDDAPIWIQAFLDADLYELGGSWELFEKNSANVIMEYAQEHEIRDVLKGRIEWLETMLAKPRIYRLAGKDHEERARDNMRRSLNELRDLDENWVDSWDDVSTFHDHVD